MKKTFLLSIVTAAFLLLSSAGCKKEGLEPLAGGGGKANLAIETVSGPDKQNCGGFDWKVKFNLNEASAKGGWIIQKITWNQVVIDCPNTPKINRNLTYWEAWEVAAGDKGDKERLAGKFNFDDQFRSPNYPDTRGNTSITGEVKFFEGLALPADFIKGNNKTFAGGLPATTEEPAFWNTSNSANHNLDYIWNCCTANGIHLLTTTPDMPKYIPKTYGDFNKLDYSGKLIYALPAWENITTTQVLVNTARQVQNTTSPAALYNSLVIYENTFAGTSEYVDQMSKVYLLLRVMYQLPQEMNSSNAVTFGGWIHPSVGNGNTYNMSWPVSITQSQSGLMVNIQNSMGFLGRGYNAAAELNYFNSNFPKRNL